MPPMLSGWPNAHLQVSFPSLTHAAPSQLCINSVQSTIYCFYIYLFFLKRLQSLPWWKAKLILLGSDPLVPGSLAISILSLRWHITMTTLTIWSSAHQVLTLQDFLSSSQTFPWNLKRLLILRQSSPLCSWSVAIAGVWEDKHQTRESVVRAEEPQEAREERQVLAPRAQAGQCFHSRVKANHLQGKLIKFHVIFQSFLLCFCVTGRHPQ